MAGLWWVGCPLWRFMRLLVAAKALAHRGENFFRKGVLLARAKTCKQRRGQNLSRHRLVDRGIHGPAAFAGVLDEARISPQRRILRQRGCREVEQPGRDDAASPPDFGDVGNVEIE